LSWAPFSSKKGKTLRFPTPGLLAIAIAATLVACGGDSEQQPPAQVSAQQRGALETVDRLQTASRRGDGQEICTKIFTAELAQSIKKAAKTSCPKEVKRKLFSPDAELTLSKNVRAAGAGRAAATVTDQTRKTSTLFLVKQGEQWRIERIEPGSQS
jgi:hypothetical protein